MLGVLPERTSWQFDHMQLDFNFSILNQELKTILDDKEIYGELPKDWSRFFVFGIEEYPNVSALLCLDINNSSIVKIDVELEDPIVLINSGGEEFIKCFNLLDGMFNKGNNDFEKVATKLEEIDIKAYAAHSEWRLLIDYLKEIK